MKKCRFFCTLLAVIVAVNMAMYEPAPVIADTPGQAMNASDVHYGTVSRANKKVLKTMFDADYYAKTQPDVVKALGKSTTALFNHFVKYGIFEGRACSADFNVSAYKSCYGDLRKAFGDDIVSYYMHYAKYGKKEKRELVTVEKAVKAGYLVTSATGAKKVQEIPLPDWAKPQPTSSNSSSSNTETTTTPTTTPSTTPTTPDPGTPTVITISGDSTVTKGSTVQLTSNVSGVTWTVDPAVSGASVSASGLVSIDYSCTAAQVTVTATKTDCTAGSKTLSITTPTLTISSTSGFTVRKGNSLNLKAYVGETEITSGLTWAVSGAEDAGTTIGTSTGALTVADGETATSLTVTVTHEGCTEGTKAITVTALDTIPMTSATSVKKGKTLSLTSSVVGTTWALSSATTGVSLEAGVLTVGYNCTASAVTVVASADNHADTSHEIYIGTPVLTLEASPSASITAGQGTDVTLTVKLDGAAIDSTFASELTWNKPEPTGVSWSGETMSTTVNAVGNVVVTVDHTGCTQGTITIAVAAAPTVAISGASSIKKGQSITLTSDPVTTNWTADKTTGVTISNGGVLTVGYDYPDTATITITAAKDNYKPGTKEITVSNPTITIKDGSGNVPTSIQKGSASITLTAYNDTTAVENVTWSIAGAANASTTIGATTGVLAVAEGETANSITVTATVGTVEIKTLTIDLSAAGTITINSATVVRGKEVTFSANVAGVTWSVDLASDRTFDADAGTLTVAYTSTATEVTVTASKDGYTSGTETFSIATPVLALTPSGTATIDAGGSQAFTVTLDGVAVANSFPDWNVTTSEGVSIANGTLSTTINSSGDVTVTVSHTGCTSASTVVTINAAPQITVETSDTAIKGTTMTFSAKVGESALTGVTWSINVESTTGISIDESTGVVTIGYTPTVSTFTVTATKSGYITGTETVASITERAFTVKYNSSADDTSIQKGNTYALTVESNVATVPDDISWSSTPATGNDGITFSGTGSSATLTISPDSTAGSVVVTVSHDGCTSDSITLALTEATQLSIEEDSITKGGGAVTLTVKAGETPVTEGLTFAFAAKDDETLADVTTDTSTGEITVAAGCAMTGIKVTVSHANYKSVTKEISFTGP